MKDAEAFPSAEGRALRATRHRRLFEHLEGFLRLLSAEGVEVGDEERRRLHAVFLAEPEFPPEEPACRERLRRLLALVLLKDLKAPQAFDRVFASWFDQPEPEEPEAPPDEIDDEVGGRPTPTDEFPEPPARAFGVAARAWWLRRSRIQRIAFAALIVGALGAALALTLRTDSPVQRPETRPVETRPVETRPVESRPEPDEVVASRPVDEKYDLVKEAVGFPPTCASVAGEVRSIRAALVAFGCLAVLGGALLWLFYRGRLPLPVPSAPPRFDGKPVVPILPASPSGPLFVGPAAARAMTWGVTKHVSDEPERRLDVPRTVAETARAAGEPRFAHRRATWLREVWLWVDAASQRDPRVRALAEEIGHLLRRASLPVRIGSFLHLPDRITWENGEPLRPSTMDAAGAAATVVVLTDGEGFERLLESEPGQERVLAALAALRPWPRCAWTFVGEGAAGARATVRLHKFECLRPEETAAYLGDVPAEARARGGASSAPDPATLRRWEMAAALSPRNFDVGTACALLDAVRPGADRLGLGASRVRTSDGHFGVAHDPRLRARLANNLVQAEELGPDGAVSESSLIGRALAFWRERLRVSDAAARASDNGLNPYVGTEAEFDLDLETACLDLWDRPVEATDRLARLDAGSLGAAVRARLCSYGAAALDARGEKVVRPDPTDTTVLPWRFNRLPARTQALLARMDFGRNGWDYVPGAAHRPGSLFMATAAAVACGLVAISSAFFGPSKADAASPVDVAFTRSDDPRVRTVEDRILTAKRDDVSFRLKMVELPGGMFRMGSTDSEKNHKNDESPQHEVVVSPFAVDAREVTRRAWRSVGMPEPDEWRQRAESREDDAELPANFVDWISAATFCNALTANAEDLGIAEAAYEIGELPPKDGLAVYKVTWRRERRGYRLPTEAEWEYACRAGTTTAWYCDEDKLGDFENFRNSVGPDWVGLRKSNPWGLFDAAGNVLEWCWDFYAHNAYKDRTGHAARDPVGPTTDEAPLVGWGMGRKAAKAPVVRGGAYWDVSWSLRSAVRVGYFPQALRGYLGFRVVRAPRRQHD